MYPRVLCGGVRIARYQVLFTYSETGEESACEMKRNRYDMGFVPYDLSRATSTLVDDLGKGLDDLSLVGI